jgi:predicted nuclease of predicted toxin-antitoxin system
VRVLLDTCVWGKVKIFLQNAGHDVIWSGDWEKDPGDEEILAFAYRERRVLVTLDKDFGELAIVFGQLHAGVIRLVNLSTVDQVNICLQILASYQTELDDGALITVDHKRVRIRHA